MATPLRPVPAPPRSGLLEALSFVVAVGLIVLLTPAILAVELWDRAAAWRRTP